MAAATGEREVVVGISSALSHSIDFKFRFTTDLAAGTDEKQRERGLNFLQPAEDLTCLLPAYGYARRAVVGSERTVCLFASLLFC